IATALLTPLAAPWNLPWHTLAGPVELAGAPMPALLPTVWLALVSTALAYATGVAAIRRLSPTIAGAVAYLEVVTAIVLAWLLLGEALTPAQTTGAIIVVAGAFIAQRAVPAAPQPPAPAPADPHPARTRTARPAHTPRAPHPPEGAGPDDAARRLLLRLLTAVGARVQRPRTHRSAPQPPPQLEGDQHHRDRAQRRQQRRTLVRQHRHRHQHRPQPGQRRPRRVGEPPHLEPQRLGLLPPQPPPQHQLGGHDRQEQHQQDRPDRGHQEREHRVRPQVVPHHRGIPHRRAQQDRP